MNKVKLRWEEIKILFWICLFKVLSLLFPQKHWVICERGTDARDNGYWFYRYMKENYPQRKVFYIIDKASADYGKVKTDAVQLGSLRSYWVLATAEKHISSHYASGLPIVSPKLFRLCGLHKKFYFLQHGVIKDNIAYLYAQNAPMKLFVCGARPEYDYVRETYGHKEGIVQYTGLARFDRLHDAEAKSQILVMPTWRGYIRTKEEFLQSDYYKCWQRFLRNEKLLKMLKDRDIQLVFYAHYEMQKYMDLFFTGSDNITLAKFDSYDVQELLKESAVLITDYSSVFFDFAYMGKPVVYYQFDEEAFFGEHYQKGYFDYREMGFGDVCTEENELLKSLTRIVYNQMRPEGKYSERIKGFFPIYDTDNCKRIYDAIVRN